MPRTPGRPSQSSARRGREGEASEARTRPAVPGTKRQAEPVARRSNDRRPKPTPLPAALTATVPVHQDLRPCTCTCSKKRRSRAQGRVASVRINLSERPHVVAHGGCWRVFPHRDGGG
ncbi:hypothetical protein RJ55_08625 [Drechmeria coniospora]|nr:hypothetical protein RJ55_08625 [Drechmeria coniospora]